MSTKLHRELLEQLKGNWQPPRRAFVFVCYKDVNNYSYGSYKFVSRQAFRGRKYKLARMCGGRLCVTFIDRVFDRKTWRVLGCS